MEFYFDPYKMSFVPQPLYFSKGGAASTRKLSKKHLQVVKILFICSVLIGLETMVQLKN